MSANIGVTLSTTKLEVAAGASVEATISVKNQSQIVDQFLIKIEGLDPAWWSLSVSSVSLFPMDQDQAKLTIRPPKEAEAKAGSYPFQIKVISQSNTQEITTVDTYLVVRGFSAWEADMSPSKVTGRSGTYKIKITNSGNADANVVFEAKDPEEGLIYRFDRDKLLVPPGGSAQANLTVRPKKGEPRKLYTFQVTAKPPEAKATSREVKVLNGQLEYPKGKNLKWLWLLLIPVVLVAAFLVWNLLSKPKPPVISPVKVTVTVTSPKNADVWAVGSKQTIMWVTQGQGIAGVGLEISTDGGSTWKYLAKNVANTGSYQLTVPDFPASSAKCMIRATLLAADMKDLGGATSDGVFTISVPVKVTVTVREPAAGVKLNGNDTASIAWSYTGTGIATVDLQYSTDGGKTWQDIATNIPNSGKYSWKVPNVSSTQCYIKVIARGADKTILHSDTSNAAFTILYKFTTIPRLPTVPLKPLN